MDVYIASQEPTKYKFGALLDAAMMEKHELELTHQDNLSDVLDEFNWAEFALPSVPWLTATPPPSSPLSAPKQHKRKRTSTLSSGGVKLKLTKIALLKYFDDEEDDDEEEQNAITSLTEDQEAICFYNLSTIINERRGVLVNLINRDHKLYVAYDNSKEKGKTCNLAPCVLSESKYKASRPVKCVLCNEDCTVVYLRNSNKCNFHITCRKCFIFTQTLLSYRHNGELVTCPLQLMGTNCRRKNII